ncbi:NAC transcription factor 29-like [Pyrus ussuriensis x Pyrus communis]|uniref:NAC transcription factor 29-like n=1 Tax=Pyrus ussuriensis x Pyrus communis TaxID=2448454 RepID=A0A5N5FSH4_9ROSA|nr:NAC transcription factor 29-like [Pyrus ussuriensis x Pyrus communis]
MASANDFPVGYKFHPRDEELVGYYLRNKVRGSPFKDENVIPDLDLYGSMEARDIWNNNGGQNLGKGEDLYFFTKLKPTSSKGTGSRMARTIGSGTWHGENSGTKVKDPKTKETIGWWKRFTYANTKYPQENGCWIMHEFSLDPKLAMYIKSNNSRTSNGDEYAVCRIRKHYDRKRKADDREETRVVESQRNKIQRQFDNIDESYDVNTDHYPQQQKPQQEQQTNLQHNSFVNNVDHYYNQQQQEHCNVTDFPQYYYDSQELMARPEAACPTLASSLYDYSSTQDPSSGIVFSHYDLPQTSTTGFANQPYHFVTQDQPNYFVADPTMASSLSMASQEDYLQRNGFVNNVTDLPQYHYSSAQPSSGTVLSHYDPPQTGTTGFANHPHHFVTQDQPNYCVADSTMASSLASPANIDQNYPVMNDKDQLPLPNFDYSQLFYEAEGDHDIMIDLEDLWNDMVQPAAVL